MSTAGTRTVRIASVAGLLLAGALAAAGPAQALPSGPPGARSNMSLCSPFLAGMPSPVNPITGELLGGNARSGLNQLIIRYGELQPDALSHPGDLYKVRAREHPTDTAEQECLPRRQP